jgi:outer membrane biosynthesis protein TonB
MVQGTHLSGFTLLRITLGTLLAVFAAGSSVAAQQQSDNPPPQSSSPSAQTGHSEQPPEPTQPAKPVPAPKPADAQPKKETKPDDAEESKLRVSVVAADTGKPVANASVYIRFPEGKTFFTHKDKQAEMNFKTNQDGSVKVPSVPRGKILVQIVAPGWHTYGKWYDIEKDEEEIDIRLDKPPRWY